MPKCLLFVGFFPIDTDTDFSESEALSSLHTKSAMHQTTTTTAAVSQSEPETGKRKLNSFDFSLYVYQNVRCIIFMSFILMQTAVFNVGQFCVDIQLLYVPWHK